MSSFVIILHIYCLRRITLTRGYPSFLSWTSASLWRSRVRWTSSSTNWLTSSWRLTRMIHRLCCWSKEYRYASLSSLVSPEEVERSWKVGQVKWIIFTSWKTWKYCAQLSKHLHDSWPWEQYVYSICIPQPWVGIKWKIGLTLQIVLKWSVKLCSTATGNKHLWITEIHVYIFTDSDRQTKGNLSARDIKDSSSYIWACGDS